MRRILFAPLVVWAVTFALLIVARWDLLDSPPFQDQAVGLWTEADFLARSGFDYHRLLYDEHHFMDDEPGPRSYMISVLPTLVAIGMRALPDVDSLIVVNRVISYALGALIVTLVTTVLWPRVGWLLALALAAAMLTTPLFLVQLDIMGMDVPLAAAMLLTSVLLFKERYVAAAALSMVAFALKATGQLITLASLAWLLLLLIFGAGRVEVAQLKKLAIGLLANLLVLSIQFAAIYFGDTSVGHLSTDDWPEILKPQRAIFSSTPDIGLLLLIAITGIVIVYLARLLREFPQRTEASWLRRLQGTIYGWLVSSPQLVVSSIIICGLLVSSTMLIYTPRYVFCAVPFLYLILGSLLGNLQLAWPRASWVALGAIACLTGANLANQRGAYFPEIANLDHEVWAGIPGLTPRSCAFTERSREYLADHESNQRAFRLLDEQYYDRPIFAASPYKFLLSLPSLGHVHHKFEVHDASLWTLAIAEFRDVMLRSSSQTPQHDPIFVWFGHARVTLPPPEPGDEIIYDDGLEPPLVLFIKHLPADVPRTARAIEDWYIEHTWSRDFLVARVRERPDFLKTTGRFDRALLELDEAIAWEPQIPELRETRFHLLAYREQATQGGSNAP
jgi:hypothetical protein